MNTSPYDALEDDFNVMKLAVEQHTTRLRAMEHHIKVIMKIPHSPSVIPEQTYIPSPSVLPSEMTKHAETPSIPVMSEYGEETETIVDISPPSTSTIYDVATATFPVSQERSTGLSPSNSQLTKDLNQNSAGIRTNYFTYFQPAWKRRPKAKVVSRKSILGNPLNGGPTTRNVLLLRVMLVMLLSRTT